MNIEVKKEGGFTYIESGGGERNLILLHGLFGALSNFKGIIDHFKDDFNVVVPILPIYELPMRKLNIKGLVDYLVDFIEYKGYKENHVLGNSLGGHIALLYTLEHQDKVASMTLTGSSGLFESAFGTGFPKRGNYDFIKKRTEDTFYDPSIATKELVDEVYSIVNDRVKALRVLKTAKSAIRHNVAERLEEIKVPTLIIWGRQDTITPHYVAEKFHEGIEHSKLFFIDKCGHAAMMEHPVRFNEILFGFLDKLK